MNKGFIKGTPFIVEFDDVKAMLDFEGEAVEVILSNGRKFVCGIEQQLWTADGRWVEAQNSLDEYLDPYTQVIEIKEVGKQHLYDLSVYNEEHKYKISIDGMEIVVHNIPTIRVINVGSYTTNKKVVTTTTSTSTVQNDTTLYIPATDIQFTVTRLKPNTIMYAFFDGKNVSQYIQPFGGNLGDTLMTDSNGAARGTFKLPNNSTMKFIAGQREFKLTDSSSNIATEETTFALSTYTYTGTNDNTSNPSTDSQSSSENKSIDPLVQSFYCRETGGMYLSKVGLYFYSKDNNQPLILQIREVNEDKILNTPIAGSSITIEPSDITVNTSATNETPTWITFNNPIYLSEGKEYAIFIVTNSSNYIMHMVDYGKQTNNITATKDINSGSLIKYVGANNWVRSNDKGIKFKLQKCKFSTDQAYTLTLGNKSLSTKLLNDNSLKVDATKGVITVTDPNHSFNIGSYVTISGLPAGTYGTIDYNKINGIHRITEVTWNTYSFNNYYVGNTETMIDFSSAVDTIFGTGVSSDYDLQYDNLVWNPNYILLTGSDIKYQYKGISGQSVDGSEQPYSSDSNYSYIEPQDILKLPNVKKISSTLNSSKFSVTNNKSLQLVATLKTANENITPVLDSYNLNAILVENVINNQSTNEDKDSTGTACARKIWKTVTLYEQSTGIKVTFFASVQATANIKMYYKTLEVGESGSIDNKDWIEMPMLTEVSKSISADDFQEYNYMVDDINPFRSFKTKMVMTSTDSTKVPLVKKYSAIAFAK